MTNKYLTYFLNSNGEYENDSTIERDHHEQIFNEIRLNSYQNREINNDTIPSYPLKQYLDEHISNDIWKTNGINNQANKKEWNDHFSENMKSSKWNGQPSDNNSTRNWAEYTQRKNPWV